MGLQLTRALIDRTPYDHWKIEEYRLRGKYKRVYSFIKWAVATATTTVTGKALVNSYIQQIDPSVARSLHKRSLLQQFVSEKLKTDGVFLVRLVCECYAENSGDMVTLALLKTLWEDFVKQRGEHPPPYTEPLLVSNKKTSESDLRRQLNSRPGTVATGERTRDVYVTKENGQSGRSEGTVSARHLDETWGSTETQTVGERRESGDADRLDSDGMRSFHCDLVGWRAAGGIAPSPPGDTVLQ
ncbi:hypothetical protein ANCDUO_08630 [Ancylostoma duodenale]|uniref:Uncharacterized protein n=1 Tax=Ancylostoma duodenale TaxID=51022 RepID=A0A0C2CW08_9BILA|nr:hypothetical protein ANCDUO_08630 [Ancylostoma duodenale]